LTDSSFPCPRCGQPWPSSTIAGAVVRCARCGLAGRLRGRWLDTLADHGRETRAATVEEFYARSPFPGYPPGLRGADLVDRARRSPFLAALERLAPARGPLLELGCGTGQAAAFLALSSAARSVTAVDGCAASLALAEEFRSGVGLANLALVRADLFDLPLPERAWPLVLCRGVVHHTPDPRRATQCVAERVAPGGLLVLGIYESLARAPHDLRRRLSRWLGPGFARRTDPLLRSGELDAEKARIWFEDQYRHPLERLLPLPQVARWLEAAGFDCLSTAPPLVDGQLAMADAWPSGPGLAARRWGWLWRGWRDRDNGLVCLLARRRG
jgi:SAM-dependent methyltransferase